MFVRDCDKNDTRSVLRKKNYSRIYYSENKCKRKIGTFETMLAIWYNQQFISTKKERIE